MMLVVAVVVAVSAICTTAATVDPRMHLSQVSSLSHGNKGWAHSNEAHELHAKLDPSSEAHKLFSAFANGLNPLLERVARSLPETDLSITHEMVPMRDGVRLSTFVVRNAQSTNPKKHKFSAMLSRSPYGPTSDQIANIFLVTNDMVALIQDQRGTFASEGEYSMWHHDSEDGFDTLAWIEKQPWSNGKVFTAGVSADGIGSIAMVLNPPPQLKGQLVMWATMDGFGTTYPGGVFREGLITGWMTAMSMLTRGVSLTQTLPDILAHHELSEWWDPIQGPGHYHQARWPTIHLSGWWDIFQGHQIDCFNQMTKLTPYDHYLIVAPMGHCMLDLTNHDMFMNVQEARGALNAFGLATEMFGDDAGEDDDQPYRRKLKKINVFVQRGGGQTEEHRTFWSSFDSWPVPQTKHLVLGAQRKARLVSSLDEIEPPTAFGLRGAHREYDEFGFDPLTPVITEGGNNLLIMMAGFGCGSVDQRVNEEERLDALVFTLDKALEEDLVLTGQVKAKLFVSTKGKDADVFVSLNDVYVDPVTKKEVSMQIRYGVQRLRARDSTPERTTVSPVEKDEVYEVGVDMWFTSYVVPAGHKLRVVVSSSSSPYYAVNLDGGGMVTWNKVHWSAEYPSRIELPSLTYDDLPVNHDF